MSEDITLDRDAHMAFKPHPEARTPMPHQREAVAEITREDAPRHRYLADDMGLGKSFTALLCAEVWDSRRILVICPLSAVGVWQREISLTMPTANVIVLHGASHTNATLQPGVVNVIIVTYDMLSRAQSRFGTGHRLLTNTKFDLVIADEAHRLKTNTARRTRAVFGPKCDNKGGLCEHADHVLLLSGTPITAYQSDLWAPLRALWPDRIMFTSPGGVHMPLDLYRFRERFCVIRHTKWGPQVTGNQNVGALRALLDDGISRVIIRRTKRMVLKDLPPYRFALVPLAMPQPVETIEQVRMRQALQDDPDTPLNTPLAEVTRRQLGDAKRAPALQWIRDFLDDNPSKKLVVFAWHRALLETLHQELSPYGSLLLMGGVPMQHRTLKVDFFQRDPAYRVFVGQLSAAGESITLTAASDAVFVETDWSPSTMSQALARTHRIGQRDSVLGHVLVAPGTLDEIIMRIAIRKALDVVKLFPTYDTIDQPENPTTEQDADHASDIHPDG